MTPGKAERYIEAVNGGGSTGQLEALDIYIF